MEGDLAFLGQVVIETGPDLSLQHVQNAAASDVLFAREEFRSASGSPVGAFRGALLQPGILAHNQTFLPESSVEAGGMLLHGGQARAS